MSANYDSTQVGVPYVRVNNITIQYPASHLPTVTIEQETAVKLADGSIAVLGPFPSQSWTLDLVNGLTTPIPLIDPTTGANLGANTTLQSLLLGITAVIRAKQIASGQ